MKACSRCKEPKTPDEFYDDDRYKDGKSSRCKSCSCEVSSLSQKANPARVRKNTRRWRERHADELSDLHRRVKFGLPLGAYEEMLARQGGCCAICRRLPSDGEQLCVDHCHSTKTVRGLLCRKCNTAISLLLESIEIVEAAKTYLNSPPFNVPIVKHSKARRPNRYKRTSGPSKVARTSG